MAGKHKAWQVCAWLKRAAESMGVDCGCRLYMRVIRAGSAGGLLCEGPSGVVYMVYILPAVRTALCARAAKRQRFRVSWCAAALHAWGLLRVLGALTGRA
jgi:hypothetical protein